MLRLSTISALSLAACTFLGCESRPFETEGDTLRARVVELETEVEQLKRREAELLAELRRVRQAQSRAEEFADSDVSEFVPHVVDISIGRLSHVRDTDGDGVVDLLRLYIHPVDGRGRFMQMVGQLQVNAVLVPDAADPVSVGRASLSPGELRDAYRSGITGTHYAVQVPLDLSQAPSGELEEVTVRVTYIDGITGERCTADRSISLQP